MADETYFSMPGVATVRWDEPTKTVVVEWDGWANSAEFKGLLDAEVKALHDHAGSRLLADCRRQRVLNPADQDRANEEWVPRVVEAGLKRFAVVLPESDMAATHLRDRLGKVPKTVMQVDYFSSVEEAREWLAL
jgi:SpoIIAA-like